MSTAWPRILIWCSAALLFLYISLRAYLLAFTWDECFSFLTFVKPGVFLIEEYDLMSANHHLLNTWLMMLFNALTGDSEFSLRLPNVLSGALYLFFAAKLSLTFSSSRMEIGSFILLSVNPYLLDFFSLARGYGLSMGCLMGSLYYLYLFTEKQKEFSSVLMHLLFAILSVLSGFSMLNYVLAAGTATLLVMLTRLKKNPYSPIRNRILGICISIIALILLLAAVLSIGMKLREAGSLYYGLPGGFWNVTVQSLATSLAYEASYAGMLTFLLKGLVLLVLAAATGVVLFRVLVKKEIWTNSFFVILWMILLLMVASVFVQNKLFGTLFLMNRTALMFIPVFVLLMIFLLQEIRLPEKLKQTISAALALTAVIHFLVSANLYSVQEWKENADVKDALKKINEDRIHQGKDSVSLLISFHFHTGINYYQETQKISWLYRYDVLDSAMTQVADYYLLPPSDTAAFFKKYPRMLVLSRYDFTGNILVRNTLKRILYKKISKGFDDQNYSGMQVSPEISSIAFSKPFSEETGPGRNFSSAFEITVGDTLQKSAAGTISVRSRINAESARADAMLVITVQSGEKVLLWKAAHIKESFKKSGEWFETVLSCPVPAGIRNGDKISAYFWNPGKHKVYVDDLELDIYLYVF